MPTREILRVVGRVHTQEDLRYLPDVSPTGTVQRKTADPTGRPGVQPTRRPPGVGPDGGWSGCPGVYPCRHPRGGSGTEGSRRTAGRPAGRDSQPRGECTQVQLSPLPVPDVDWGTGPDPVSDPWKETGFSQSLTHVSTSVCLETTSSGTGLRRPTTRGRSRDRCVRSRGGESRPVYPLDSNESHSSTHALRNFWYSTNGPTLSVPPTRTETGPAWTTLGVRVSGEPDVKDNVRFQGTGAVHYVPTRDSKNQSFRRCPDDGCTGGSLGHDLLRAPQPRHRRETKTGGGRR